MASFWASIRRMARLAAGPTTPRRRRPLMLEGLEERTLLTTTVYLDFGEGFAGGSLAINSENLRDRINGPDLRSSDVGGLGDGTPLRFDSLATVVANQGLDFDGTGGLGDAADYLALRDSIVRIVRRQFEPFDVDVVVASARNLDDVNAAFARNTGDPRGQFDAYVLVAGVVRANTAPNRSVGQGAGLLGVASGRDTQDGSNTRDEAVLVFADNFSNYLPRLDVALATVASHEAGHSFGLDHTHSSLSPEIDQLNDSDIMVDGGGTENDLFNYSFFSRFDLVAADTVKDGKTIPNTDPKLTLNAHDQLVNDPDIGRRRDGEEFITGTGAHDTIFLGDIGGGSVIAIVTAYSDAAHTNIIGSTVEVVSRARGILVDAGFGNDSILISGNIFGTLRIRGGIGTSADTETDTLTFETASPFATTVAEFNRVRAGNTTVAFEEINQLTIDARGGAVELRNTVSGVPVLVTRASSVRVGNGSLGGIVSDVSIDNPGSTTAITIDGATDNAFRTLTLDTRFAPGRVFGQVRLDRGTIIYRPEQAGSLKVLTGTGGAAVYVRSAHVPVTLAASSLNTTVHIGDGQSLANIRAPITVGEGFINFASVIIDAQRDARFSSVDLGVVREGLNDYTQVTVAGLPAIKVGAGSAGGLTLHTSTEGSSVRVNATATAVTLVGHSLTSFVSIGNGSLAAVRAGVTVRNEGGATDLTVNDTAGAAFRTFTLDSDLVGRLGQRVLYGRLTFGGVSVRYHDASTNVLTLFTGTAPAAVDVLHNVTPLQVFGNGAGTRVTVGDGSLARIWDSVFVSNAVADGTAVTVDGSADAGFRDVRVGREVRHRLSGPVTYGVVSSGGPLIRFSAAGTSSLTVLTPDGAAVRVLAAVKPVAVLGNGPTAVTVGNEGSLAGIKALVSVSNTVAGATSLTVDDSRATRREVTLDSFNLRRGGLTRTYGQVFFDGVALVQYVASGVLGLTLHTGAGGATVEVLSAVAPVTLIGHAEDTVVNVGVGDLGRIRADVTVTNDAGQTRLTVDGSRDLGGHLLTLDTYPLGPVTFGQIGIDGFNIRYRHDQADLVALHTGLNTTSVEVRETVEPVRIVGHSDLASVFFGKDGLTQGINAAVSLENPFGFGTIAFDNSNDPNAADLTLDDGFAGLAPAPVTWDAPAKRLVVLTGTGADTVRVRGRARAQLLEVQGGGGADQIHVGTEGQTLSDLGDVLVLDHDGEDTLELQDQGELDGRTYTLGQSVDGDPQLRTVGTQVAFHGGLKQVIVRGGQGANAWVVEDLPFESTAEFVAGAGDNNLTGPGVAAVYRFRATGEVEVRDAALPDAGGVIFSGPFSAVLAGGSDDTFAFEDGAGFGGFLDGGGGVNTLDYSAHTTPVRVHLPSGEATGVGGVGNIRNAVGGAGDDLFLGDGNGNTFDGGDGRDVLIAGGGAAVLRGGAGEDLLAGGPTAFDGDPAALAALLSAWSADGAYDQRVEQLLNDIGLDRDTFFSNGAQNTLLGGAGELDLFFGSKARDVNDLEAGERFIDPEEAPPAGEVQQGQVIDVRGLGVDQLNLDGTWYDTPGDLNIDLQAGSHYLYVQGTVTYFTVNAEGAIDYDDALEGALTGRGTQVLGVNGRAVSVDVSSLGLTEANIDGVWREMDGATALSFMPGQHYVYVQGTVTYFTVNSDGTIDYDPSLEGALSGRGTTSLSAVGHAVSVDVSALGLTEANIDGVWRDLPGGTALRFMPGQHYLYVQGTVTYFTVNADGTIDYDSSLEGALTGRGTTSLARLGRVVNVDVSALGLTEANIDGVWREMPGATALRFMPGQHYLYAQGTVTYFTVNADGSIDYDASLDGALAGRGTTDLIAVGREVTIDATVLSGASWVNIDGVWHDPGAPLNLRLMPGQHYVYTADGRVLYFTVNADGSLDYDAALDGTLAGRGAQALVVLV